MDRTFSYSFCLNICFMCGFHFIIIRVIVQGISPFNSYEYITVLLLYSYICCVLLIWRLLKLRLILLAKMSKFQCTSLALSKESSIQPFIVLSSKSSISLGLIFIPLTSQSKRSEIYALE